MSSVQSSMRSEADRVRADRVRTLFPKLYAHTVKTIQDMFAKEKSFQRFHFWQVAEEYFKQCFFRYSNEEAWELVQLAQELFIKKLNPNNAAFASLSDKEKFCIFLAMSCPIPEFFHETLTEKYKFELDYTKGRGKHLDTFRSANCTCNVEEEAPRCFITRTKLGKCRWEQDFEELGAENGGTSLSAQGTSSVNQDGTRTEVVSEEVAGAPELNAPSSTGIRKRGHAANQEETRIDPVPEVGVAASGAVAPSAANSRERVSVASQKVTASNSGSEPIAAMSDVAPAPARRSSNRVTVANQGNTEQTPEVVGGPSNSAASSSRGLRKRAPTQDQSSTTPASTVVVATPQVAAPAPSRASKRNTEARRGIPEAKNVRKSDAAKSGVAASQAVESRKRRQPSPIETSDNQPSTSSSSAGNRSGRAKPVVNGNGNKKSK